MNWVNILNEIVVIIGIPTLIGASIYIGRQLEVLDSLVKTMDTAKHNLKVICDKMISTSVINPAEIRNYSPLALTEQGEKLLQDFNFPNIFNEHKSDFFSFIDQEGPKLKYDVEVAAIKSIYVLADKEYMNFLKVFFYNTPTRNMDNTAPTLGLFVRDRYLEEHLNIVE